MDENSQRQSDRNLPEESTPEMGGGLPVIKYWAEHTLSPEGAKLWQKLLHKSACLSCAWGTEDKRAGLLTKRERSYSGA